MTPRGDEAVAAADATRRHHPGRGATPACEVPIRDCGATAVLLGDGPVRVPFRACCAAALVPGLRAARGERAERPG